MDAGRPYLALTSRVDGAVLTVLVAATEPLTGREISRRAHDGSQPAVQAALAKLTAHGLVHQGREGRSHQYTLNRDHVAMPAVTALHDMRAELVRRLGVEVAGWAVAPAHLSLFGAMARADGDPTSNVDLLLARAAQVPEEQVEWRSQVATLQDQIQRWAGNRTSILEVTLADLRDMVVRKVPFLREAVREAIDIAGQPLAQALEDALTRGIRTLR